MWLWRLFFSIQEISVVFSKAVVLKLGGFYNDAQQQQQQSTMRACLRD
jgi:hypothetical protein